MLEVFEIISKVVLLLGLFFFAWFDYKTKMIRTKWLMLFGLLGIILRGDEVLSVQMFTGMIMGGILLLVAYLSNESIGIGDGLLFIATGTFLNFAQNLALLFGSLLLAGVFAIACLVLKKKGRNDRVALGPFVLAAYVVFVL